MVDVYLYHNNGILTLYASNLPVHKAKEIIRKAKRNGLTMYIR